MILNTDDKTLIRSSGLALANRQIFRLMFRISSMRNLSDAALQLELEKAQRLVRMIEAEIRLRRTLELEEEVRKEMKIQREMAMRRVNVLGFLREAPPALLQETRFSLLGLNAFNMASPPLPAEINATDMNRESEGRKEKLILLPKPNPTRWDEKRKAEAEIKEKIIETDEFVFQFKSKKKAKVIGEWKCELCNILTNSENCLNDHLRGKKHMAKAKAQNPKTVAPNLENWSAKSVVSSCSTKNEVEKEEDMNFGVKFMKD